MMTYIVDFSVISDINDDKFYQLCRHNPDVKFERNDRGQILIMSPTGGETGNLNSEINAEFVIWNRQSRLGKVFDSSTCFKLPNGANRSPDVSWVELERWNQLTIQQREKFPPLAPDFVLELMSPSDNLTEIQAKMQEYMDNKVKLGWLIDPQNKTVEIYRQGREKEVLHHPSSLSGENVLPGFSLDLELVW